MRSAYPTFHLFAIVEQIVDPGAIRTACRAVGRHGPLRGHRTARTCAAERKFEMDDAAALIPDRTPTPAMLRLLRCVPINILCWRAVSREVVEQVFAAKICGSKTSYNPLSVFQILLR